MTSQQTGHGSVVVVQDGPTLVAPNIGHARALSINGGRIAGDNTGDQNIQTMLDGLGVARGAVLYRGLNGWALLDPSTAGYVLSTNGEGAAPSWVALAGGGDALTTDTLDQFADVTQAAGKTLDITDNATLSGTNTGDQTSIVGISGTIAEFNTACSDADFATGGGTATGSNTGDQNVNTLLDGVGSTKGDMLVRDTAAWAAITAGVSGTLLTAHGAGTLPTWTAQALQTITLTTDVTGSGTGSFAATIAAGAVTAAKCATGVYNPRPEFMPQVLHDAASTTATLALSSGVCYAHYLGKADRAYTTITVMLLSTVSYVTGGVGPFAQVGIATGTFAIGAIPTGGLTIRGYLDVTAAWTAAPGIKTHIITGVSGVTAGTDIWFVFGAKGNTAGTFRGVLPDVLQSGCRLYASGTAPSALSGTAMTLSSAAGNGMWMMWGGA